jgi:CubicO group peptidase (beta-lactamase class C family)
MGKLEPKGNRLSGLCDFSDEGLVEIQNRMEAAIRDGRIPSGIAMLACGNEIVWLATAGDMGPGTPMRDDVIIPLASAGKMYTAVAAMILCEQGVISLHDPVSKYIPEFSNVVIEVAHPSGNTDLVAPRIPITIYHLLTHTGGLQVSGDSFWAAWKAHSERTTTTDLARALAKLPLRSQPGEKFEYGAAGASYEVIGAVIEISTNQTLEAFMMDQIFEPIGLNDTYFYLPAEKSDRMPAFYRNVDGMLQLERPFGVDFPRTTFFHGGGGVESSPQDILRFMQLFLNDGIVDGVRLLTTETVHLMMTDHLGEKSPFSSGLSWGFGAAVLVTEGGEPMQYGWVGGGYTTIWVDLREKLVAYFAFPVMPPGDSGLLDEFRRLVYSALGTP